MSRADSIIWAIIVESHYFTRVFKRIRIFLQEQVLVLLNIVENQFLFEKRRNN